MTFDEFVEAELPALARYARVLTGDRELAHDVLADALVHAQLRWRRIGGMDHPGAYVRRIVTTTHLGHRRRWSTRHITLTATGDSPELPTADDSRTIDNRSELHQLLASLPRRQRAAIVLRHYLGLSDHEVADELGCAPVTVRSYISRGLAAMRCDATDDDDRAARGIGATPVAPDRGSGPSVGEVDE